MRDTVLSVNIKLPFAGRAGFSFLLKNKWAGVTNAPAHFDLVFGNTLLTSAAGNDIGIQSDSAVPRKSPALQIDASRNCD